MRMNRSPNDNRLNSKNPNNPAYKAVMDNRLNKLNLNNPKYEEESEE